MSYVWPIMLVIVTNVLYQICTKSVPSAMHPLASLTITYSVAAVTSGILYFALQKSPCLRAEYAHVNWAPFVLGLVIVGLEVGFIYAYKAGWPVSTAATVQSAFVAIALLVVGWALYGEAITWSKAAGILICLAGLALINR